MTIELNTKLQSELEKVKEENENLILENIGDNKVYQDLTVKLSAEIAKKERLKTIGIEWHSKLSDLQQKFKVLESQLSEQSKRVEDNKQSLVNICSYFIDAGDKEMSHQELAIWLTRLGDKLNLALNNY